MKLKALRPMLQAGVPKPGGGWSRTVTAEVRGYGANWRRIRTQAMQRDAGLCRPCARHGYTSIASDVDHIVSRERWRIERGDLSGADHPSNLQAICSACHRAKTTTERFGRVWDEAGYFECLSARRQKSEAEER
jgi:5-methylcytosine-specific restriction protein A